MPSVQPGETKLDRLAPLVGAVEHLPAVEPAVVVDLHRVGGLGIGTGALAEHAVLQARRRGRKSLRGVGIELAGAGGELRMGYFGGVSGHGGLHEAGIEAEGNGEQCKGDEGGQTHLVDS
jgi:hypothetical protein